MSGALILAVTGLCAGLLVSCGLIAVLLAVSLIPRFAGKTHTGRYVFFYEEAVILGALAGTAAGVFPGCREAGAAAARMLPAGWWQACGAVLLAVFGLFAGAFTGAFAVAVAEMLDSIPIFARRIGFRHGLGIAMLAAALGKLCGSLFYFAGGLADWVR